MSEESQHITRSELMLELKALRSDMRVLILGSVALNQFLSAVSLPSSLTVAAVAAFTGKALYAAFTSRGL